MLRSSRRLVLLVPGLALLLACALPGSTSASPGTTSGTAPGSRPAPTRDGGTTHVVAISLDGFNPTSLRRLGRKGTPHLHWLRRHGATTLNARTAVERTETLPNHTGMLTGRRIDAEQGGHGVTFNYERPRMTVQRAAGRPVASIFDVVHDGGGTTALYTGKAKFRLFERSWPDAIDTFVLREGGGTLIRKAVRKLRRDPATFTFVHLAMPDLAGHAHGFMGRAYLAAVRRTDRLVGRLLRTIRRSDTLGGTTAVVLTADHGGKRGQHVHNGSSIRADYRVPFMVWAPGVPADANLYAISPDNRRPGGAQPSYRGRQPIRNAALANVSAGLLGLDAVPGSEFDVARTIGTG